MVIILITIAHAFLTIMLLLKLNYFAKNKLLRFYIISVAALDFNVDILSLSIDLEN